MGGGWRGSGLAATTSGALMVNRISSFRSIRLGQVQPQAPGHRTFFLNDRDANALAKFMGNSVSTTKYDVLTFLPTGLFEQFRRVVSLYFLVISILSCTPIRHFARPEMGKCTLEEAAGWRYRERLCISIARWSCTTTLILLMDKINIIGSVQSIETGAAFVE